jgi:hypothetical protein
VSDAVLTTAGSRLALGRVREQGDGLESQPATSRGADARLAEPDATTSGIFAPKVCRARASGILRPAHLYASPIGVIS